MKTFYTTIICIIFAFQLAAQNKYYVKTNGFPSTSGRSWTLAVNDIQNVLDVAQPGDSIFVAVGIYKGGFVMKDGVTIQGGYTANTSIPFERIDVKTATDPSQQSILDGEGKQRVITQYSEFSRPTTWDGFVIQNGMPPAELAVGNIIFSKENPNAIVGVVFNCDPESGTGLMIGVEEVKKQWGGYLSEIPNLQLSKNREEAKTDMGGLNNSDAILNLLGNSNIDFSDKNYTLNGNYAAFWCDTLNNGYSDWRLPSAGEMQEIYDKNINRVLKGIGKELKNGYWTSSHVGNALAWTYYFECAHLRPVLKYISQGVRAVHLCDSKPSDHDTAGGGAFLSKNGILKNCIVQNNHSSSKGGGVYAGIGSSLIDCIVEGNSAPEGNEVYYETNVNIPVIELDKKQIMIYPNPVKAGNSVEFSINGENTQLERANVCIWDMSGRIVYDKFISSSNISAPSRSGIYFVRVQYNNNIYISKLVVY